LRVKFKAYEYESVILPIIFTRRLVCVFKKCPEDQEGEIRAASPKISDAELNALFKKLELDPVQCPFCKKIDWTLRKACEEMTFGLLDNPEVYNGLEVLLAKMLTGFRINRSLFR